jgi:hypothetical protein
MGFEPTVSSVFADVLPRAYGDRTCSGSAEHVFISREPVSVKVGLRTSFNSAKRDCFGND